MLVGFGFGCISYFEDGGSFLFVCFFGLFVCWGFWVVCFVRSGLAAVCGWARRGRLSEVDSCIGREEKRSQGGEGREGAVRRREEWGG